MDLVTIGMTILAMSIVVMVYLECTQLVMMKLKVSQLSRRYILKMETQGYLPADQVIGLLQELQEMGVTGIDITGTTLQPVAYGDAIYLKIKGSITGKMLEKKGDIWNGGFQTGKYTVEEFRVSTAKY